MFVDDRCELFGGPWLREFAEVVQSSEPAPAVARWDREYGTFDFALTRTGTAIDEVFRTSAEWSPVKVTPTATFYKRK